ncbi:MAG: hypothetical protein B6U95_04215 [Thermofilum sp. ex4484_82]|nr:hypothetical protein [Thermoproteales archaeon]OYT28328.1 MAG: hypothetical protein B6U95_04215 [Thermofilum sp. ex4484_82]OYT38504.1 MAG: hypothetical protein B6U96_04210 [Archaeoglobales archaeon ex4484_92]
MIFRKFTGVKFSSLYYKNPPDEEILKRPLPVSELKEEIGIYVKDEDIKKTLISKVEELHSLGYIFVSATLNERTKGHAKMWVEEIEKGIFAVKNDEKILLYKVNISYHYANGALKHQSKYITFES